MASTTKKSCNGNLARISAIDTGTSLFAMPTEVAEFINGKIGAKKTWSGQYTLDCATVDGLPELKMRFAGKDYTLAASDYVLRAQGNF